MKPYVSNDPDTSILQAEVAVRSSISRFESAMEHLADKVEGTTHKVQRVSHLVRQPKVKLMQLENKIMKSLQPLQPYFNQAQVTTTNAIVNVRANPKPAIVTTVGLVAGFILFKYLRGSQRHVSTVGMNDVGVTPIDDTELYTSNF